MSVRFDHANGPQSLEAIYPLPPASGGIRLVGSTVSVTLWIYLDEADVPDGTAATIWWFGEGGQNDNNLVLEAVQGSTQGFNLRATLTGQTTLGPVEKEDLAPGAWHCVSVVLQGQSGYALRLYVDDDNAPDTTSGAVNGVSLPDWDTFTLARNPSTGAGQPGSFYFEHAAIWNAALGAYDTASMFTQRIPPSDGERLTINEPPDFSYWFCTAHSRSGIVVRNRADGWPLNGGEFFNQSTLTGQAEYPQLRIPDGYAPASWDSLTPVMRYDDVQAMTPIADRVINPPSRLQPHFWFFNEPDVAGDVSAGQIQALAFYHDPNMSKFGQADYRGSNQLAPPVEGTPAPYYPERDLAQSAKRMADWFELMGFTAGKGTGAGDRYAGCLYVRGVGLGGPPRGPGGDPLDQVRGLSATKTFERTFTGAPVDFVGRDDEIPLEMHPLDWVLTEDGNIREPWASWYRTEGSALVRGYMAGFWEALKWELDDRGLCYPLRIHFDYEGWPRGSDQLTIITLNGVDIQAGCWPDVAADGKWSTEDLLNYGGSTIENLIAPLPDVPGGTEPWDPAEAMYSERNNTFQQWWDGLSVVIRMQALAESVFADLATFFPETKWGNYYAFVADDPNFKYPDGDQTDGVSRWFNTPVDNDDLVVPGDFSTPILYSNENLLWALQGDFAERIGYSFPEVVRDFQRMRLDAVFSARSVKAVVPTMENFDRLLSNKPSGAEFDPTKHYEYIVTREDLASLMAYAWQRGADEFVMFTFDPSIAKMEKGTELCGWLRDWVHTIPQARQDRVGRVSRLGRRGM
jgi:hypothetical protein